MNFSWRQVFRCLIIIVLSVSVIILFTPFLIPLILGGILSVVIYPLYKKMVKHGWNPSAAALTTLLVFSLVFAVPTALVVIKGARVTSDYVQQTLDAKKPTDTLAPDEKKNIKNIEHFAQKTIEKFGIDIPDPSYIFDKIYNSIGAFTLGAITDFFTHLPDFVVAFFIALLTMYFGLIENKKIHANVKKYCFLSSTNADKLIKNIVVSCRGVIVSNVVTGAIQALIVATGAHFTDTGNFFVIGFVTFILSFIPVLGAAPVAFALGAYALVSNNTTQGIVMMVVGTFAGVIDNIIRPMMLSGDGDIHPLWSLLGILGGIILFGLPGLFVGPLILAVAFSCLPIYVSDFRQTSKKSNGD
jgi:predicted PurR-regulated permease PerM